MNDTDDLDERVARSTRAVRTALSQLLHEGPFATITVQQILDRAGVARATFYKHYRSKDEVLAASFEAMLDSLTAQMHAAPDGHTRLLPVRELLDHIASAGPVVASLRASDRLERLWDEATPIFAARLEPHLTPLPGSAPDAVALTARVIGGALVELVRWSLAHPGRVAPAVLDARFQEMARRTGVVFGCEVGRGR